MDIKEVLKNSDLTLEEISRNTGINYHTLQKYSSGARKISVKNAKVLGRFLGFHWWLLFEEEKEGENERRKNQRNI